MFGREVGGNNNYVTVRAVAQTVTKNIIQVLHLKPPSSVFWHFYDILYFSESFPYNIDERHCLPLIVFWTHKLILCSWFKKRRMTVVKS